MAAKYRTFLKLARFTGFKAGLSSISSNDVLFRPTTGLIHSHVAIEEPLIVSVDVWQKLR
jgi:hypothetical protein